MYFCGKITAKFLTIGKKPRHQTSVYSTGKVIVKSDQKDLFENVFNFVCIFSSNREQNFIFMSHMWLCIETILFYLTVNMCSCIIEDRKLGIYNFV